MQYCSEKDWDNKCQGRYFDDTSLHLVSVLINLIACFPSWSRHEETNLSSILHSKKMYCGVEAALSISLGTSIQFGPCPLWLMDGLHNAFNKQLFKEGVTTEDPGYDFHSYSKGSHHFFCSQICLIFWSWSHLHGPLACFSHPGCWRWGCEFVTAVSLHKALKHQQSLKASSFLFLLGRVREAGMESLLWMKTRSHLPRRVMVEHFFNVSPSVDTGCHSILNNITSILSIQKGRSLSHRWKQHHIWANNTLSP